VIEQRPASIPVGAALGPPEGEPGEPVLSIRASLDVPGETRRQAIVLAIWISCLALAVLAGSAVGTHIPADVTDPEVQGQELGRSRLARAKVALSVGVLSPLFLTWYVTRRRKRGGPHPRGIRLEITQVGELRFWGRGYGTRLPLSGARVDERLVDLYAGRLGAWRERRMRVSSGSRVLEIGTPASADDDDLPLEGGEGDCVEFDRDDYLRIRSSITQKG
jgi:hypothetical protein